MREIKFRVWDKINSKMYFFDLEELAQQIKSDEKEIPDTSDWCYSGLPVMQYTGLKDKNGVEIYEGDIVKYEDNHIGNVWQLHSGLWVTKIKGEKGSDMNFYMSVYEVEVIGNVYENGELLTKDKNSKQQGK